MESLKKNNPNDILANDYKESELSNQDASTMELEPLKSQQKGKKERKYLRLDITDYQNYISLMADYERSKSGNYISMTQYILRLIEADKQKNNTIYEKLERIDKMKQELI